jgi:hypothetical protein
MKRIIGAALAAILCAVLMGAQPAPVHAASAPPAMDDCQGLLDQLDWTRQAVDSAYNYAAFAEAQYVADYQGFNANPPTVSGQQYATSALELSSALYLLQDARDNRDLAEQYAHEEHCI